MKNEPVVVERVLKAPVSRVWECADRSEENAAMVFSHAYRFQTRSRF